MLFQTIFAIVSHYHMLLAYWYTNRSRRQTQFRRSPYIMRSEIYNNKHRHRTQSQIYFIDNDNNVNDQNEIYITSRTHSIIRECHISLREYEHRM